MLAALPRFTYCVGLAALISIIMDICAEDTKTWEHGQHAAKVDTLGIVLSSIFPALNVKKFAFKSSSATMHHEAALELGIKRQSFPIELFPLLKHPPPGSLM